MNKQELIDEYINNQRGKFPMVDGDAIGFSEDCILFRSEFQQRASELGWINGYKWGVEYPTNGKKPDLPDDVLVDIRINNETYMNEWRSMGGLKLPPDKVDEIAWDDEVTSFRIIDERYKPVEQKLESPEHLPSFRCETDIKLEEKPTKGISDAICSLTEAINTMLESGLTAHARQAQCIRENLTELAETRAKELERERVVDKLKHDVYLYAINSYSGISVKQSTGEGLAAAVIEYLHEKGFLKLP